jgi:hypothetical protein
MARSRTIHAKGQLYFVFSRPTDTRAIKPSRKSTRKAVPRVVVTKEEALRLAQLALDAASRGSAHPALRNATPSHLEFYKHELSCDIKALNAGRISERKLAAIISRARGFLETHGIEH